MTRPTLNGAQLVALQVRYANAMFLAARYTREAEIAKRLLDDAAIAQAESQFVRELGEDGQ